MAFVCVLAVAGGLAVALALAAWQFAPAITGRLQPWVMPLALSVGLAIAGVCVLLMERTRGGEASPADCHSGEPAQARAILAAIAALAIVALGARAAGLLPTLWLAGTIAALGVRGCGPARAIGIGLGLAGVLSLLFVAVLRQPLPLLPEQWREMLAPVSGLLGAWR